MIIEGLLVSWIPHGHLPLRPQKAVMSLDDVADTGGRLLQSAAGSGVGVAVSSLSFRIVFALRTVMFL